MTNLAKAWWDYFSELKKQWEHEMTIEALLKDIKASNDKIVSLLHNSRAAPMADEPGFADWLAAYMPPTDLDPTFYQWAGRPVAVYHRSGLCAALQQCGVRVHHAASREELQQALCHQIALKAGEQVKAVPAPRQITREQVERCILRATNNRRDIIPTYNFADVVDNVMELIRDDR